MKRITLTAVACLALMAPAQAQDNDSIVRPSLRVRAEARVDWQQQWDDGHINEPNSGFKANMLDVRLDGNFNSHFSYALKQRFDKSITKSNFFESTPWAYVTYTPVKEVSISAGKQVVCIGGFEYDRAPIDEFFASEFWYNISCYQLGVSGSLNLPKDRLTFQVTQSPFFTEYNSNMYAYNLMWSGSHGPLQTLWSLNLSEYDKGRFISYIALGNKLTVDNFSLEFDFMNRASSHGTFLFRDCSVMADAGVKVTKWLRPFAKYTYDVNHNNYADLCVLPGTELNTAGFGFEAWPLLKKNMMVRLHADLCYTWGKNGNIDDEWFKPQRMTRAGMMTDKRLWLNLGVTWSMTLCDIK